VRPRPLPSAFRRAPLVAVLLAALFGRGGAALAHRFEHPKIVEAEVRPDHVVIWWSYDVDPGEASRQLRALFDRDADGRLSPAEQSALTEYLVRTAGLFSELEVDGAPVTPERISTRPSRVELPTEASQSLGVRVELRLPLPDRPRVELRWRDRDKDARRHVPLTLRLDPGWRVRLASQGELEPSTRTVRSVRLGPGRGLDLRLDRGDARVGVGAEGSEVRPGASRGAGAPP
jgi:hypothetical protein